MQAWTDLPVVALASRSGDSSMMVLLEAQERKSYLLAAQFSPDGFTCAGCRRVQVDRSLGRDKVSQAGFCLPGSQQVSNTCSPKAIKYHLLCPKRPAVKKERKVICCSSKYHLVKYFNVDTYSCMGEKGSFVWNIKF